MSRDVVFLKKVIDLNNQQNSLQFVAVSEIVPENEQNFVHGQANGFDDVESVGGSISEESDENNELDDTVIIINDSTSSVETNDANDSGSSDSEASTVVNDTTMILRSILTTCQISTNYSKLRVS